MAAHTRFFTTTEGVRITYATLGQGPPLVVIPPWLSHLELFWDTPPFRAFNEALARDFTVVLYDRYGCGLSDRDRADFSLDPDIRVLAELVDHLRLRRFALYGVSTGALVAVPYALAQPRRVSHLLLFGIYRKAWTTEVGAAVRALIRAHWGLGSRALADWFLPGAGGDALAFFARLQREAASAETALALLEAARRTDQLDLFPRLRVPTLVLSRRDDPIAPLETARDMAARIPGARFAALEGDIHIPEFGDAGAVIAAIRAFVDAPPRRGHGAASDTGAAPTATSPTPLGLSPREVEVLRLLAGGLSNPAIAARLALSVHTVERHVVNLYTKLGIHGRAEATAYALRHGLLAPPAT
jgi:pimeloyl-ACP methyl ester carboxylesterase/DNA-binding CsgD family transcriptional regulator